MNTLIHADIFFFITTIVVVLLGLCFIVAMVYIIKILRDISELSDKIKHQTSLVLDDVELLRGTIKQQAFKYQYFGSFFASMIKHLNFFKNKSQNNNNSSAARGSKKACKAPKEKEREKKEYKRQDFVESSIEEVDEQANSVGVVEEE